MATVLGVFKVAQNSFLQKLTKDTAQMVSFLVFNESATAKIALCTYLKPTLNGHYVGCPKLEYLGNIQLLVVTAKAVKVSAGAITKLRTLE